MECPKVFEAFGDPRFVEWNIFIGELAGHVDEPVQLREAAKEGMGIIFIAQVDDEVDGEGQPGPQEKRMVNEGCDREIDDYGGIEGCEF